MKNWEDLTLLQKIIIGLAIVAVAVFAPEIAMLIEFGGIEVAFTFLLFTLKPIIAWVQQAYSKLKSIIELVVISYKHSASAKPAVFAFQASFCCLAFLFTGSIVFAFCFFMPSMLFNGVLI